MACVVHQRDCTIWSHFVQLNLGGTWRIAKKLAGTYSNISLTFSPSLLTLPPQSGQERTLRWFRLQIFQP
jgi:hypothetical protein